MLGCDYRCLSLEEMSLHEVLCRPLECLHCSCQVARVGVALQTPPMTSATVFPWPQKCAPWQSLTAAQPRHKTSGLFWQGCLLDGGQGFCILQDSCSAHCLLWYDVARESLAVQGSPGWAPVAESEALLEHVMPCRANPKKSS